MSLRSLLTHTWHSWKSYRLPWRARILIGTDLEGNTYWEHSSPGRRPRRIVAYRDAQLDLVDYKLTPQWHQWLRYTRADAPSTEELRSDQVRVATLRRNAAVADARWRAAALREGGGGGEGRAALEGGTADSGGANPWREADERREGFQAGAWDPKRVVAAAGKGV